MRASPARGRPRGLAEPRRLAILTKMSELDGGGHERRPGSGIPARGAPNPAARPPGPDAEAGEPAGTADGPADAASRAATGPTASGFDLWGRHVTYDGWTPPSDDPLFGGVHPS
jgi:hypothetical protein